jgi:hypothetical protein
MRGVSRGSRLGRLWRLCALIALAAIGAEAAQARCAYVDVNTEMQTAPTRRCFNLDHRCRPGERWGCFKARLELKPGVIRQRGQPEMRETAAAFGYVDPLGVHWDVPAGFLTDGASIPLAFQPLVGGSWDQRYLHAAVLHDFYIRRLTADPESVHRLFFHAMLASGTTPDRAALLYWAVRNHGPQWKAIDLAEYERKRSENLARIEAENERFRVEYEACLLRHVDSLRGAPPGQRPWANCLLDGRHEMLLDIVTTLRDVLLKGADDLKQGKCRRGSDGTYNCAEPEVTSAERGRALGACNYQCGFTLCCARETETQCAARPHSRFIEGDADACPEWAMPRKQ